MAVREYDSHVAGVGGQVSDESALAYRNINIADALDRQYLQSTIPDPGGDAPKSWLNYRRTGEVRYGVERNAHIAGYTRFIAAKVDDRGRVMQTKESGVEAEIVAGITSRFGGVRGLVERYYTQMKVPGQAFFTEVRENLDGTGERDGYWFLSAAEIAQEGHGASQRRPGDPLQWRMRRAAGSNGHATTRLILPEDFRGRVWMPDHEFTDDTRSPMQSVNGMCEQLHILTETIAGRLKQRFALAGILLIPNEINDAAISGDSPNVGLYSSDKVMNYLIHVMTTNVANHAKGLAAIPIILKGPAAVIDKVRHLVMDATIAETDLKLRAELIGRILTALDQQKSAVEGMDGQNHWGAWMVSDEERRISVQPDIENLCHILTRMVLWRELQARGRTPGSIRPWRVWFDLSAASVRSNLSEDARQGWDRGEISGTFLRTQMGAGDEDAPNTDERVRQMGWKIGNPILATYGLEGVEVDWDRAAEWNRRPGPNADSPADESEVGPGNGQPGSPDDRDSDTPKTEEPG